MVSVLLTILLCVLSYVLGSLIGWERTVKMQKATWRFISKKSEKKTEISSK